MADGAELMRAEGCAAGCGQTAIAAAQGRADGFEGAVMEALLAAPEDWPSRS